MTTLIDKLLLTEQFNIKTNLSFEECASRIRNLALVRVERPMSGRYYDLRRLSVVKPLTEFAHAFAIESRRGQNNSEIITVEAGGKILYDEISRSTFVTGTIHLGSLAAIGSIILGIFVLGVTISFLPKGEWLSSIIYFVVTAAVLRYGWLLILEDKKNLKMLLESSLSN